MKENKFTDIKKFENVEFDGVDPKDAPDYSDAFIVSADYDGIALTEEELDEIDASLMYELLMIHFYGCV